MTEIMIVALVVLTIAITVHAARKGAQVKALNAALQSAHERAEWLDAHVGAWEQRATDAEADLDAMKAQRDNIQALYTDFVRKTFGERVWVVQWSKTKE